jgi:hypothetical protein
MLQQIASITTKNLQAYLSRHHQTINNPRTPSHIRILPSLPTLSQQREGKNFVFCILWFLTF